MMSNKKEVQRLPVIDTELHRTFKSTCAILGITLKEGAEEAIKDFLAKKKVKLPQVEK